MAGCSTAEVELAYQPAADIAPADPNVATFQIGQFSDRRDRESDWLGEIRGKYYYPKTVLRSRQPVAGTVRDLIEKAAADRALLSTPSEYQLYGQILDLDVEDEQPAEATVQLVIRLLNVEDNDEIYNARHYVLLNDPEAGSDPGRLGDVIEEALNQAIAESLDDPDLISALRESG